MLCALTGLVQWAIPRCPEETVRCDEDRLYRLSGNHVSAYSIRSGRPLLAPGMSELNETLSGLNPTGIMTFVERPGDGLTWELAGHRVRAGSIVGRVEADQARWDEQDLLKLETVWTLLVKVDSRLGVGPPGQGVLLDSNDELKLIDWSTGQTQSLGQAELASENSSEIDHAESRVKVCWDRFQVYVLSDSAIDDKSLEFPAIPVKGTISVHSRNRSAPEWNRVLEGYLLTSSFQRFPCLAILRLEELQVAGYPYQNVHLTLLDKQSGNIVYQLNTKSFSTGVSGSQFDPKSQQWDLSLQTESLRVQRKSTSPP